MDTGVTYRPDNPLVEQTRPPAARLWTLNKDRLTIGRDSSSDICVDDPGVSARHAEFLRRGSSWSIVDVGSTNGTFVNGSLIMHEVVLRAGDRIDVGGTQLLLRPPVSDPAPLPGPPPIRYDVGTQVGTVSNVAGNQSNYYTESTLRYIATRRGRARRLIVWGIVLFLLGNGLGLAAVLAFQGSIIDMFGSTTFERPNIPEWFFPAFGAGAFLTLIGIALFIFGLIARSGAKREARRLGAEWS